MYTSFNKNAPNFNTEIINIGSNNRTFWAMIFYYIRSEKINIDTFQVQEKDKQTKNKYILIK